MKVSSCVFILILFSFCDGGKALRFPGFFIPEELQTILSVFYSHLPPTKIGSDKRFGVGFRLGRNVDAQILIELGPQSETQPLGNADSGFSKRESGRQAYEQTADKPTDRSRRRQKTAGRTKKRPKSAGSTSKATEIYTNVNSQLMNNKTAEPVLLNDTTTVRDKENKIESATVKIKTTKLVKSQKKVKPAGESIKDQSSLKNNEIDSTSSQRRPDIFLNNLMSWLTRFNQQRNITQ